MGQILTAAEAAALLEKYAVILPRPVYKLACNGTLYHSKPREGQDKPLLLEEIVARRCPEYMPSFEKFVYGRRASFGNMLVAKRETFCAYSAWMFPLLEEFERLGEAQGILDPRMCGFVSEYLLCIWPTTTLRRRKFISWTWPTPRRTGGRWATGRAKPW